MDKEEHKKIWISVLLNFFIWGLGYIYLKKKVGLGILLLILDIILVGISFSNLSVILDPSNQFLVLIVSIYLALDAYRLLTGNKFNRLSESSQKIVEKCLDIVIVLIVIFLLIDSVVLTIIPKGIETLSSQQSSVQDKIINRESSSNSKTIKIYIDTFPYGVDKKYENSIREAMSFWEKNRGVNFQEVRTFLEADVYIKWFKEFGTGTLGHTINQKGIDIGLGDSNCLQRWRPYSYNTVLIISEHELGHALGADDDYENPNNIMYYKLSTKYEIDIDEEDILPDGWTRFYPVCTKNSVASYTFEITSNEPLDIYVVPSKQDYEFFTKGQQSTNYPKCQEMGTNFYQKTCTIESGSGVILKNPSELIGGNAAQFKIKVKEN